MGEKGAAATKQASAPWVPSPRGLGILVAGAAAPRDPPSGADRGQGGQGCRQLSPGPSGCQARASPDAGPRAAPAAQHQQEADGLPQVQMIAPGQRPVPARVPSQLGAWRQRHGREIHRVVALGLHWAGKATRPETGPAGSHGTGGSSAGESRHPRAAAPPGSGRHQPGPETKETNPELRPGGAGTGVQG